MRYPEYLDGDGYPTEAVLDLIKNWNDWRNMPALFDIIEDIWWMDGWGVSHELKPHELALVEHGGLWANEGRKYVRLATGGWSGNESLIYALRENPVVWSCCWRLSACGGLHIFWVNHP